MGLARASISSRPAATKAAITGDFALTGEKVNPVIGDACKWNRGDGGPTREPLSFAKIEAYLVARLSANRLMLARTDV